MIIDGEIKTICVYTLAFLGDMPQLNELSGIKRQIANRGCRACLITEKERSNLDFDIVSAGRYHHQTMMLRRHADTLNKGRKNQFCQQWGLREQTPVVFRMMPA